MHQPGAGGSSSFKSSVAGLASIVLVVGGIWGIVRLSGCKGKPPLVTVHNGSKSGAEFRVIVDGKIKGPYKSDRRGAFDESVRISVPRARDGRGIDRRALEEAKFQIRHPCGWVDLDLSISGESDRGGALMARDTELTKSLFQIVVDNRGGADGKLSVGALEIAVKKDEVARLNINVPNCDAGRVVKFNDQQILLLPVPARAAWDRRALVLPTYLLDTGGKRCYQSNYSSKSPEGTRKAEFQREFAAYKSANNTAGGPRFLYVLEPAKKDVSIFRDELRIRFEESKSKLNSERASRDPAAPFYGLEVADDVCKS